MTEDRLAQSFVDIIPGMALLVAVDGRICVANAEARRRLRIGLRSSPVGCAVDLAALRQDFQRAANSSTPLAIDFPFNNGGCVPVMAALMPPFPPATERLLLLTGSMGRNQHARIAALTRQMRESSVRLRHARMINRRLIDANMRLSRRVYRDNLTKLLNRRGFLNQGAAALAVGDRHHEDLILLYGDLNDFKPVNDHHGHAVGDKLLEALGLRLAKVLRKGDIAARLGGDEFAVLLTSNAEQMDLEPFLTRLCAAMSAPVTHEDRVMEVSISWGVARYPAHGTTIKALLRAADKAMYYAKSNGHAWSVFHPRQCVVD
ncbi:MAG: GGDEF domain-containing protein, partial [Alphaproteobacteria bacterium]